MARMEGTEEVTLECINEGTQAWIELDYNRGLHAERG